MESKEKNHATLAKAIRQLPGYQPAPFLWEAIEASLSEASSAKLRETLQQLPEYNPPGEVWQSIEAELSPARRLMAWQWAAAASAVLIAVAYLLRPAAEIPLQASYTYELEAAAPVALFENDWEEDDAVLQDAVEMAIADPLASRLPATQALAEEWEELMGAREEIQEMMAAYGKDSRLIRQLAEIERERAAVAKQMVAGI